MLYYIPNVFNLRVDDIGYVDSYATIVAFMSALKPAQNMRQPLILQESRTPSNVSAGRRRLVPL